MTATQYATPQKRIEYLRYRYTSRRVQRFKIAAARHTDFDHIDCEPTKAVKAPATRQPHSTYLVHVLKPVSSHRGDRQPLRFYRSIAETLACCYALL